MMRKNKKKRSTRFLREKSRDPNQNRSVARARQLEQQQRHLHQVLHFMFVPGNHQVSLTVTNATRAVSMILHGIRIVKSFNSRGERQQVVHHRQSPIKALSNRSKGEGRRELAIAQSSCPLPLLPHPHTLQPDPLKLILPHPNHPQGLNDRLQSNAKVLQWSHRWTRVRRLISPPFIYKRLLLRRAKLRKAEHQHRARETCA